MPDTPGQGLVGTLTRRLLANTVQLRPWRRRGEPADGRSLALPHRWRRADQPVWFHHTMRLADAWRGCDLLLHLDVAEGLLFVDGTPYHGLDRQHRDVVLSGTLTNSARIELAIEASRAAPFGGAWFRDARVGLLDEATQRLLHAVTALRDVPAVLRRAGDRDRVGRLLAEIDSLLGGAGETGDGSVVTEALALVDRFARGRPARTSAPATVHLVGHSHIDVVWLWTLAETRRKCARTFSTTLRLMERYPSFRFAQSQAQLYAFVKELYPELYAQVRERVREGRWEPVGSTWVEPDCNIPNGESLVRQIVYGRRFFAGEFGTSGDTLWLPDTFGYAWSLPQILRLSGIRSFFTTKLLWNDTTRFPRNSFWWEGIDGSRVLAHNPPVGLEGLVTPQHIAKSWHGYAERRRTRHVLQTFGYGDGGGGVTAQQLDAALTLAAVPGLPSSTQSTASGFFAALARDGARLPVWRDELYLELHRGTYTTHAWLKRANREAETSLYTTDLLCAMAVAARGHGEYDDAGPALESLWKRLLVNQFHDIVPGTAVEEAYADTRRDFAEIVSGCEALQHTALARALPPGPRSSRRVYTVFNPLPWDRVEHVRLPARGRHLVVVDGEGRPCPSQRVTEARISSLLCETRVPAMGCAHLVVTTGRASDRAGADPGGRVLDTPHVLVRFDRHGTITSLIDRRHGRDIVSRGHRLNEFQTFRDEPVHWEAWDIDPNYASKAVALFREASVRILERGPVRWRARIVLRSGGRTRIDQDVVIHRDSPRIDFLTRVRWHERLTLLKVAFPLAVITTRATYEIPFGAIARPTVARTARDRARWEVAGQQWADLSGRGYGVSLLNDCKYGYDCVGTRLRLTLIRSPRYPHYAEPMTRTARRVTDQGEHRFAYALWPHAGTWRDGETVRRAREFNVPVLTLDGQRHTAVPPLLRLDAAHVQVSAVAPAERPGDLLVRLYECHGVGGRVTIRVGLDCDAVRELDLNERPGRRVALRDGKLRLTFRPFQIRTLQLTPGRVTAGQRETSDVR